jgi:hypothetical protein
MALSDDTERTITNLPVLLARLSAVDRKRFDRIYDVRVAEGRMRVPTEMVPWVERTFGPVGEVETQTVVRVSNRVTGEGTLFNGLRARRPVGAFLRQPDDLAEELRDDAWADPLTSTPEDAFGRVQNEHGVSAANVARFDAAHSIIVFSEPNPLAFTRESVAGQMELARQWIAAANRDEPAARFPYVMWNCLWRAGGSIVHGHAQVTLARGRHYGKIERLRADAAAYEAEHGIGYFGDLAAVHASLGLASDRGGVRRLAHLSPVKEKEVVLLADAFDDAAAWAIHDTLAVFRDALAVRSFNMGVLLAPMTGDAAGWEGFPVVIRMVDRGSLSTRTSDIGGMEMFAESVVASDPFAIHQALSEAGV